MFCHVVVFNDFSNVQWYPKGRWIRHHFSENWLNFLPSLKTNNSPLKIGHQKETSFIFQRSIFRCFCWSFRNTIPNHLGCSWNPGKQWDKLPYQLGFSPDFWSINSILIFPNFRSWIFPWCMIFPSFDTVFNDSMIIRELNLIHDARE